MKKALALTLALTMLLSLAACGDKPSSSATPPTNGSSSNAGTNAPAADPYPEKNIDFIIPAAPGGAMATAVRQFQPYAEENLGVRFNIESVEGGAGVIGINKMLGKYPDGYTLSIKSEASLICNWLVNKAPFGLEDFDYLCTFTTDPGAVFVRKDAPYQTLEEFVEYTRNQPAGSVSGGISTPTDMCHIMAVQMEEQLGVDWNVVGYTGGSKARLAVVNGEVDALFCNYFGSVSILGDTNVLGIAKDENNLEILAGIPTINDALGIDIDEIDVRYVLFTEKGFMEQYPERYETLYNALRDSFENSEYLQMMKDNGQDGYIAVQDAAAASAEMAAYNELLAQYAELMGA